MSQVRKKLRSDVELRALLDEDWERLDVEVRQELEYRLSNDFVYDVLAADPDTNVIVAEGDSWFDLPLRTDILDALKLDHERVILESKLPHHGHTLEDMVYGPQMWQTLRYIERHQPAIVLFSAGGNDIAGEEFVSFLNHRSANLASVLRVDFAEYIIETVMRKAYSDFVQNVSNIVPDAHIIFHGYGHPLPDGRGIKYLIKVGGPWLRPALVQKGIDPIPDGRQIISHLINDFNEMLASLAAAHTNCHYIDLRRLLPEDSGEDAWKDELHPRKHVFEKIADLFEDEIDSILGS